MTIRDAGRTTMTALGKHMRTALASLLVASAAGPLMAAWPRSGGGLEDDTGRSVAVAASGNVYVVGSFRGVATFGLDDLASAGSDDVFVTKMDQAGNFVWARSAGGLSVDRGVAIAVDASENVYVTGSYYSTATFGGTTLTASGDQADVFIAKLGADGNWKWARTAGGNYTDVGYGIGVTPADDTTLPPTPGSVFVAGRYTCNATFDSADGSPLDSGCSGGVEKPGLFVARLDTDGNWKWVRSGSGRSGGASDFEWADALAVDRSSGNLYLTGPVVASGSEVTAFADNFNASNSLDGTKWSVSGWGSAGVTTNTVISGSNSLFTRWGEVSVTSAAIDLSGRPTASVSYWVRRGTDAISEDPDSGEDLVVEYLAADGTWVVLDTFPGGTYTDETWSMSHDLPTAALYSGFRVRFRQTGGSGSDFDYWHIDDVLVSAGSVSHYVAKITDTVSDPPAPSWQLFGTIDSNVVLKDLVVDPTNPVKLYAAGTAAGTASWTGTTGTSTAGAVVAALNTTSSTGTTLSWTWARAASGGQATGVAAVSGVALPAGCTASSTCDPNGVYITGPFTGTATFQATSLSSGGGNDVFVAKVSASGSAWVWASGGNSYDATSGPDEPVGVPGKGGGPGDDLAQDIGTDGRGALFVTGSFHDTAVFGDDEFVESVGAADAFIAEINLQGQWFNVETWIVGQPVPAPNGAYLDSLTATPEFVQDGQIIPDAIGRLFFWAPPLPPPADSKATLYALQPTAGVEIHWRVSGDLTDKGRVISIGNVIWPQDRCLPSTTTPCYQVHVAGAPVELEPADGSLSYFQLFLPAVGSSGATETNKTFNAAGQGYGVVAYYQGPSVDPNRFAPLFEVVRTYTYPSAPDFTPAGWEIGRPLIEPFHDEPGRTGYVLFENAFYDGVGTDGAYDRQARTGQIVPVNRVNPNRPQDANKLMVVAWYRRNHNGVYWGERPVQYNCYWPTNPDRIIIASEQGGEVLGQQPLDPLLFPSMQLYNQPDVHQPGYNPNDEHAFFAPSSTGTGLQAIFALRSDFGSAIPGDLTAASDPYVIVKYWDSAGQNWAYRVYKVQATGAGFDGFRYNGTAGTTVSPPYPARILPGCAETSVVGQAANDPQPPPPFFMDYKKQLWAKSAGDGQVLYHYPLQPTFFYDVDNNDIADRTDGQCVPWLARLPEAQGGTADPTKPIAVAYSISWPADVPQLIVGETLLTPKRGLPDIMNQAAVEVVYDEKQDLTEQAGQLDPTLTLTQLIDPLNPRSVRLGAVPSEIATEVDDQGKLVILGSSDGIIKIPFSLRERLRFDPINRKLSFAGYFDESGAGEPLLLLNVLSKRDRVMLKKINGGDGSEASSYSKRCSTLDDACSWDEAVEALFRLSRNPNGINKICTTDQIQSGARVCLLSRDVGPDDVLIGWQDSNDDYFLEPYQALGVSAGLTAGAAQGTGYVTLAFNNDASLNPLPVSLNIIRVDCLVYPEPPAPPEINSTYQGEIKVIPSDNVFDEQLTLRHSGDFGGNPDALEFEWYYHPDEDGTPPFPLPDPDNGQLNGWFKFPVDNPYGALEITIEGANIVTLSDNWFVVRYRGLPQCNNQTEWSLWAGQPGGTPLDQRAQLALGWVKRVVDGLNPFEARVKDFHAGPVNTYASMLVQLGERYEGDIALNADASNLNSIGLIEAYETVMRRAMKLSIDSTPPVDYGPVNTAILNVASRIADFYTLLGNEAYADALDPTIGITTTNNVYGFGSLAPTIFNFENQAASLLEEELVLLRGRDNSQGPVAARPVYNRYFWNFTGGEGEVAYALSYNITDQNVDGVIDEYDARILYPQGHGDAWGHYLTAMTKYYQLLRHPFFTWLPRPEAVLVAGVPIQVDYFDERKFAKIAAAKAKAGEDIVNLTYRESYVEDPAGQWQGYKDTNPQRAWGLAEWASRAGMGAYFDWVVGNAILPAEDPNPDHHGIQKIDRTTVDELADIVSHHKAIQAQVDKADRGLNPLGLAKGVVPFDIDPSQIDAGKTHFEQILDRANAAMDNVVKVWDFANQLNRMLRFNQDNADDLYDNSAATETDYQNQLVEVFGYPYDDDIGPGGTYPTGYDGPDLYHYMLVDAPAMAGLDHGSLAPAQLKRFTGFYGPMPGGVQFFNLHGEDVSLDCGAAPLGSGCTLGDLPTTTLQVDYVSYQSDETGFAVIKDPSWTGSRRATGKLQDSLAQILQSQIALKRAVREYDNLRLDVSDTIDTMKATFNIKKDQISIKNAERKEQNQLTITTQVFKNAAIVARRISAGISTSFEASEECVPDNMIAGLAGGGDLFSTIKCATESVGDAVAFGFDTAADAADIVANSTESAKEDVGLQAAIESSVQDARLDLYNIKGQLDQLLREEPVRRSEVYAKAQELQQAHNAYRAALAEGQRLIANLVTFRKNTAATVQQYRYRDMAFRIFRNDALQKYRAAFDMAARYTYLAATAYDYETNLLGTDAEAGQSFLTDIVRERSIGQVLNGEPVPGSRGLADPIGRMTLNFQVLKGQMGFNNPQTETNRFSLRKELFRIKDDDNESWRRILRDHRIDNLWNVQEFRRYCRPFAPESSGAQPGLVIPFSTTVTFGLNFFGWPLGPGDSAYDPTHFATKVRGVGVWFGNYENLPLSNTPRVYMIPVGADVLRSPSADNFKTREWTVVDQVLPVPFPIGSQDLESPTWTPLADMLSGPFDNIRRFSSFRAYHYSEPFSDSEIISDSRLIGRSVWNTKWLLIIPGGTLLFDPTQGLDTFVEGQEVPGSPGVRDGNGVSDIKIFFQTYAYSGN